MYSAGAALSRDGRQYICTLTLLFVLFSVAGWVFEVVLEAIAAHGFVNRGFLWGPYLPIYGFGVIAMLLAFSATLSRLQISIDRVSPACIFLVTAAIATVLEYTTSVVLEYAFGQRWWDYSGFILNVDGRICLPASTVFGLAGLLCLKVLFPGILELLGRIPRRTSQLLAAGTAAIFLQDLVHTVTVLA